MLEMLPFCRTIFFGRENRWLQDSILFSYPIILCTKMSILDPLISMSVEGTMGMMYMYKFYGLYVGPFWSEKLNE